MTQTPTYDDLLEALKGLVGIVEAYRYSAGLGANQLKRLETAKAVVAKAGVIAAHAYSAEEVRTDAIKECIEVARGISTDLRNSDAPRYAAAVLASKLSTLIGGEK